MEENERTLFSRHTRSVQAWAAACFIPKVIPEPVF